MSNDFSKLTNRIFNIQSELEFESIALLVFNYQYTNNPIYRQFCDLVGFPKEKVNAVDKIPFLPISFFKSHQIKTENFMPEVVFSSSGTSGAVTSAHHVRDLSLYSQSFIRSFEMFYGRPEKYVVLGLLPNYLERDGSSLVYMVDSLIKKSNHPKSGFYLHNLQELADFLKNYENERQILLIGVSYALLDLSERYSLDLSEVIVMETGGMKGKRQEKTKHELHALLKNSFNLRQVHSEYGMTELLSQAYSVEKGVFKTPPWMKVLIREYNDPGQYIQSKSGGINVIDLANLSSCSFIATDDLGRVTEKGFEVLGRYDNSDLRGCNLLVQ